MPAEADTHMFQCTICKEWYHKSCEHIPDAVFRDPICDWNALCVPKDEMNRQGYTHMYNSWVGVLHVCTLNFMPFIKNKIYLQFTNCAT